MKKNQKGAFVVLSGEKMDKVIKKVMKAVRSELDQNAEIRRKSYQGGRDHYLR